MPDAIYARYSSHNQDGGTSIEVQLEQCRAVCGPDAIEYIDRAVTGTTMARPRFNEMLADAEAGRFDRLIVYKFDRFGRSAYAHAIVADLEALGVQVVSATEGDDPLSRGIQLVIAEDYSRKLSERTRLGRAKRFQEGRWLGGVAPFGYERHQGGLRIKEDEADAVRTAFRLYASGSHSLKMTSRHLESLGFSPRRTDYWSHGAMSQLIKLPLYRGIRRFRDLEARDESLRIVTDDLFFRAQEQLKHRGQTRTSVRTIQAFSGGVLQCGCCGFDTFRRRIDKHKGKKYPPKWVCGSKYCFGAAHCPDSPVLIESEVVQAICETFMYLIDEMDDLVSEIVAEVERQVGQTVNASSRLQTQIAKINQEIQNVMRVVGSGALDDDAAVMLAGRLSDLKRDRDRLTQECREYQPISRSEVISMVESDLSRVDQLLSQNPSGAELNALLKSTVGPMTVHANGELTPSLPDGGPPAPGSPAAAPSGTGSPSWSPPTSHARSILSRPCRATRRSSSWASRSLQHRPRPRRRVGRCLGARSCGPGRAMGSPKTAGRGRPRVADRRVGVMPRSTCRRANALGPSHRQLRHAICAFPGTCRGHSLAGCGALR